MEFCKLFPLRFCINLGRREDRRFEVEARFEEAGIPVERFQAVDARNAEKRIFRNGQNAFPVDQIGVSPSTHVGTQSPEVLGVRTNQPLGNEIRGYDSAGRYALALTQRMAIREAERRRAPAVMLFEDDVVFHPNFKMLFEAVEIPDDWGIFYLGCTHNAPPQWAGTRVVKVAWGVDTHAIAVRAPYYRKVIELLDRHGKEDLGVAKASDQIIAFHQKVIPSYACYPNLAWQDVSGSDLLGREYSNYTTDGFQRNWQRNVSQLLPELVDHRPPEAHIQIATHPAKTGDIPHGGERPLEQKARRPPKLGLLFLTRGDVNHPDIWREFVQEAPDRVRIFSHNKDNQLPDGSFLARSQIRSHFETEWGGIALVKATRALLLEALEDVDLTHFALLSESCVPIRPLPEILRRLDLDPRPQFKFKTCREAPARQSSRIVSVPEVPAGCWRFQPQWWLFDRVSAVFSATQDFTDLFDEMYIPDECYFSTILSMQGYPLEGQVLKIASTWTYWKKGSGRPTEWMSLPVNRLQDLIHSGAMFARKFPKGSDIGNYGLHKSMSNFPVS